MPHIVTPGPNGWGDWKELAAQAKLQVSFDQQSFGDELMARNPLEKVEEERFAIHNPLTSREPAALFFQLWGIYRRHETLHPLPTLAALAAWGGNLPSRYWNVASPYILTDGKGGSFILCIDSKAGNVLSFVSTEQWIQRPVCFLRLTSEVVEYE